MPKTVRVISSLLLITVGGLLFEFFTRPGMEFVRGFVRPLSELPAEGDQFGVQTEWIDDERFITTAPSVLKYDEVKHGPSTGGALRDFANPAAYVFSVKPNQPVQILRRTGDVATHETTPFVGNSYDRFGESVAVLADNIVAIGAPGEEVTVGQTTYYDSGVFYLFDLNHTNSPLQPVLRIPNPEPAQVTGGASFAQILTASGHRLFVGVPTFDLSEEKRNVGRVYVYEFARSGNTIVQKNIGGSEKYIDICNPNPSIVGVMGGEFGHSLATRGEDIIIGAYLNHGLVDGKRVQYSGEVYVYTSSDGYKHSQFPLSAGGKDEYFGWRVVSHGQDILVDLQDPRPHAYLYRSSTDTVEKMTSKPSDPKRVSFGRDMEGLTNRIFLIGDPYYREIFFYDKHTSPPALLTRYKAPPHFRLFGDSIAARDKQILFGSSNGSLSEGDKAAGAVYLFELRMSYELLKPLVYIWPFRFPPPPYIRFVMGAFMTFIFLTVSGLAIRQIARQRVHGTRTP